MYYGSATRVLPQPGLSSQGLDALRNFNPIDVRFGVKSRREQMQQTVAAIR
jgi:hypothetical protein